MYKILFLLILTIILSTGCSHKKYYQPWIELKKEGECFDGYLVDRIYLMGQHEQTLASFQIGKIPDSGNGDVEYLYLESGPEGYFYEQGNPMFDFRLKYAFEINQKICIATIKQNCLNIELIYQKLSNIKMPIGLGFDKPTGINILHGSSYFISLRDGQGNRNSWSHYASDHPLKITIDEIFEKVESCRVIEN